MPDLRAHRRITIGRNIALTAATAYALVRALVRLAVTPEPDTVAWLVTYGGAISWVWAAAWALAALLCIVDMIRHQTRLGLSLIVALCVAWGTAHLGQWIYYGLTGTGWISAIEWYAPGAIILGGLIVATAQYDQTRGRP